MRNPVVLCFAFLVLSLPSLSQKVKTVKIGMCSDVHLPTMHDGAQRLTTFLDSMKVARPDFIIELGDFVTPAPAYASSYELWKAYPGKKYHVIGNHEMDAGYSLQQALEYRNMTSSYYSFSNQGFLFLVLDGNDKQYPDEKGYREYIGPAQIKWLKGELKKAKDPVVIFSHQGLGTINGIVNQKVLRSILEEHNASTEKAKVIACFNGHTHADIAEEIQGIWYITINSMAYEWLGEKYEHIRYSEEVDKNFKWIKFTAPYKDALFTVVEISTDGHIRMSGKKSEWVGPSPWELGYPTEHKQYIKPEIAQRDLKFPVSNK